MQAMAGQRKQKIAAAGFQPLLLGVFGQESEHLPAYAQVTRVRRSNDAGHSSRHLPITPVTSAI